MTILIILVVLIAVILGLAATRPNSFRLERSITIAAPPARVFALLDDFHQWSLWSPWDKLDPAMSRTFTGSEKGVGAVYGWVGNTQVGEGRMEIIDAIPPTNLKITLEFIRPFPSLNLTEFVLLGQPLGTSLSWAMSGPVAFPMKVMQLFVSMDKMVGKDFEAGLASIKAIAESS